jgi:hypothetical protein
MTRVREHGPAADEEEGACDYQEGAVADEGERGDSRGFAVARGSVRSACVMLLDYRGG